jgi:hypothetical protein
LGHQISSSWALLGILFAVLGACEGTTVEGPLCLDDCELCSEQGCPDDRCGVLYILSGDCEGKVDFLEVTVDQCLEAEVLTPGTGVIGCKTLKDGESGTITARSEDWVWVEDVTCTNKHMGTVIPVSFYCISQSNE